MTIYISHRINTIQELKNVHSDFGVEIDLRDKNDTLIISHDPFCDGENFETFLQNYKHRFIILNIKSERIEYRVLDLIEKYNISNYFFLDSSFPMIYKLSGEGIKNIAIRLSEYETIETVLNMKDKVEWVWIDCFNKLPLDINTYNTLKNNGFKICLVSPELQGQDDKIEKYRNYLLDNEIFPDMVCTKSYNISRWINSNLQVIIPMSGIGKRFVEKGYKDPKPLIKIDDKPIIEHVVNLFPGEKKFTFICNDYHLQTTNMSEILKSLKPDCKIFKVSVNNRKGPVDAVFQIFNEINDSQEVIVSYCDYGTRWNYSDFLNTVRKNNVDGAIVCYKGFHPHMLGTDNYAFCREENNFLLEIQEKKPFTDNKMNEFASNGTYYFKSGKILKKYFKQLIDKDIQINNEFYVSMVYNLMVQENHKVYIYEIENMLQWGTPFDLETYRGWSDYFKKIIQTQQEIKNLPGVTTILPMAGKGSRFSEKGYQLPKPLLDVNGLPMVVQAVNCLPKSEKTVFICLNEHLKESNISTILQTHFKDIKIIGINEVTEGQACTCEIAINSANINPDSPILISACDNGVYYNHQQYENLIKDQNVDVVVWSFRNNQASAVNKNAYAWLKVNEKDEIEHVSCKKFIYDDPTKTHAIIGTMFFRKARYFMDGLAENYKQNIRTNGEFYVDDILNQNIKSGLKVKVFESEHYICWGTPNDYETYLYWQVFFDKCWWHPYKKILDITSK